MFVAFGDLIRVFKQFRNFSLTHYKSARKGTAFPHICGRSVIEIKTPSGKTFTANRYRIENGIYDEIMIYWYQGRGRIEASEYRDKINTVWDSTFRRRSDGALVRVMTSVGGDEQGATKAAIDLSAQVADKLSEFVPE